MPLCPLESASERLPVVLSQAAELRVASQDALARSRELRARSHRILDRLRAHLADRREREQRLRALRPQ
jgi:hypothetical protein